VRVLITSPRFPHAVAEVRAFGAEGHEVFAADTFWTSPGIHSRYVKKGFRVARPALETERFVEDIARVINEHGIELVVPTCEEGFYLAKHRDALPRDVPMFLPPFETMTRMHNKSTFVELAASLGLRVPRTVTAHSQDELRAATREFESYLGRAAYSRGGTKLLTNTGPLAGRVAVEDCHPTAEQPWIVQEFLRGHEVCTFSVAQHGRVTAHLAYEHPKVIEHAGGISFVTVPAAESLPIARRLAEATGYHGQFSLDLLATDSGLALLECNPRPTAGVCMMPTRDLVDAILVPPNGHPPSLTPPGNRGHIAAALLRDMFHDWRAIPEDLAALWSGVEDTYWRRDDRLPGAFQWLSYTQLLEYRRHERRWERRPTDLIDAQFYDIAWNGEKAA
jgi:predicted ATP-grasp superfamily ATP-dependent carboligase